MANQCANAYSQKKRDKRQFLLVNFVYHTISYLFIRKARQFLLKNSSEALNLPKWRSLLVKKLLKHNMQE